MLKRLRQRRQQQRMTVDTSTEAVVDQFIQYTKDASPLLPQNPPKNPLDAFHSRRDSGSGRNVASRSNSGSTAGSVTNNNAADTLITADSSGKYSNDDKNI